MMRDPEVDIAVVGIGCNFPGGEGLDNFWKVLLEGKNCALQIPDERFVSSHWYDPNDNKAGKSRTAKAALMDGFNEFDHKFFGITETEVEQMDPQQKLLLQCAYRALENAGIPMEKASGTKTGVFIGLMNRDYEQSAAFMNPNLINHCTGTGLSMSIAANRVSYIFNFTGPSLSIDCACSSSLVALHLACQAIRQGDCQMALCGGVNCIIQPLVFVALSKAKMISPEGTSKPFSSRADGYGRGEGCGVLLLKPLKQALKENDHVWGIISNTAVNQDGHTVTPITKPSMVQQEELLRGIYSESDLLSVQYIEAHGTGTPVGDPIEAGSISKVIAKARPPGSETLLIGSVKGNIGHTESAAGVAGLIKVLLMMKHETIVPSLFYTEDSASIDAKALNVKIPTKAEKWRDSIARVAGINNFGFGGTNAHAIVKQHKQSHVPQRSGRKSHNCFVLSASSEKSMSMMMEDTIQQIDRDNKGDLEALAYTSACRRSHLKHKYRKAFRTPSLADLKDQLKSAMNKVTTPSYSDPRLVFVFCGNGVTYQGMCQQLLKHEPVFREKISQIEMLFQKFNNMSIIERLESESESKDLSKPDVVQPLLFAIQVGIASLFKHWGIKPDAILGHSVGEVAAAHCSGLLSLEDAVKVIYFRSTLQNKVTGGKMLVVSNMVVSEVLNLLPSYSNKVSLAAFNSPQSCTLSGDAEAIDSLHRKLSSSVKSKNLFLHVLDVPAAYHSQMMDPILSQLEDRIGSLQVNDVETELFSTVTGKEVEQTDFSTGKYWARNIRDPVSFEQAVRSAAKEKKNVVFVEIGPRRALQRNIQETLGNDTIVLPSVQPNKDHETVLNTVSKLFELGVQVDWDQFYRGRETSPTPFPRYQFDSTQRDVIIAASKVHHTLGNHPVLTHTGSESNTFSCDLSSDSVSYLHEHKHSGVAIIPGSFYTELGLAAFMASAKPKVPLNTLQVSISFQSPYIFTQNSPEIKVQLEPAVDETHFKIYSPSTNHASGTITCKRGQLAEEQNISLSSIYKRCNSVLSSDTFYTEMALGGFQYGTVFQNTGDVHYGEEFKEAFSVVTVPEELLSQLHEYCIHPVVLDFLMQLAPVTVAHRSSARPGFPVKIGSLTVFEPLQEEMIVYLKAIDEGFDHFEVCGCFTDKEGRVLVELKHVMITYLGSRSRVVDEYFFHNDFNVVCEDINSSKASEAPKALVFSDQVGLPKAMQPHLSSKSRYISFTQSKEVLSHGFPTLLANLNITDLNKHFQEVLFVWGQEDVTSLKTEYVLENMVSCCEMFRKIVLALRTMQFTNSIRVITYQSAENTVDHISAGFVLSGMTRSCAAEMEKLSFQLIDINSVSTEDIRALSQVLKSYPCKRYPELVVKGGQILKPDIVHTPIGSTESTEGRIISSMSEPCIFQTNDACRMTNLSAIPCDVDDTNIHEKSVMIQLSKIGVHSSDYYSVSVSDLNYGQTMYWNNHTSQKHQLLALDFSGTVTAVGKDVNSLKVGDHVVSCYPIAASSKIVIPEAACYKTKRLTFLKEAPCVSYFVLAWEILHRLLPRVRQQRRLSIISSVSDSSLLKVLIQTANKSGWKAIVGTPCSGMLVDAILLLPPFDTSLLAEASNCPEVRHVVIVCESQSQCVLEQSVFKNVKDSVHIQTVQMSSILQKGSLIAKRPHIYRWLKSMHLDRRSFSLETSTFQRMSSGSIDFLSIKESESYFSSKTLSVVALGKDDSKGTLSNIQLLPNKPQLFQKKSVYIVTGGLSGLGFETVKFLSQKGGEYIVILSRSSPTPDIQQEIAILERQWHAHILWMGCDVSVSEHVLRVIGLIGQKFPSCPIKGVFHSAVVLHDGLIETLDKSHFEKVLKPKVNGALNLHNATKHCKLDYFVCYSSISSFLGNASQTNYSAANSFLDYFCQYRRNNGLSGQSINWGALNLGLLLNKDHLHRFLETRGLMVMDVIEIHESLEQCLLLNKPQQVICRFHIKNMMSNVLSQNASLTMRMTALVDEAVQKLMSRSEHTSESSSPSEYIRSVLSKTIGVDKNELDDESPLSALGIDSMLAMTLQNLIFQDRGVNVPLVTLLDPNGTLSTLVSMLTEGTEGESQNDDQKEDMIDDMLTRL